MNSRLDELQAAILRARLPLLARTNGTTTRAGRRVSRRLAGAPVNVPVQMDAGHVYHLFPVRSPRRTSLQAHLRAAGIETLVHYPVAISQQPAFASTDPADCPNAIHAADEVLSLPLYPGLPLESVEAVADAVRKDNI